MRPAVVCDMDLNRHLINSPPHEAPAYSPTLLLVLVIVALVVGSLSGVSTSARRSPDEPASSGPERLFSIAAECECRGRL